MQINKNNFFIYSLLFTIVIVTIYFYFFSNRNIHTKFIYERVPANSIFESFRDHENIKKINDFYKKEFNRNYFAIDRYQEFADNLSAKIIRFLENNKNYKYEYKKIKKLSRKEFKKLEKILNNVSLEGAYFLQPEHIDKVTINLFLSKKEDEEIFLKYFKYIVEKETLNSFETKKELKYLIQEPNIFTKANLFRDFHYQFLNSLNMKRKNNNIIFDQALTSIPEETINKVKDAFSSFDNIDYIIHELECPFTRLNDKYDCKIISKNTAESLSAFYKKLKKIKLIDQKNSTKQQALNYLVNRWIFNEINIPRDIALDFLNYAFSKDYLIKLHSISKFQTVKNELNENYDFYSFDIINYDSGKIINRFSDIKKVETKSNHLELLSYLVFALMFSFVSHIIYRSFSKN